MSEVYVLWHDKMKNRYRVDAYKIQNDYVSDKDMLDACNSEALGSWEAISLLDELNVKEDTLKLVKSTRLIKVT